MQFDRLKRREFITLAAGAAASWPLAARAQQRIRRIGVLLGLAADDPESLRRVTVFAQTLQQLGWSEGRGLNVEYRWAAGDVGLLQKYAAELVALAPDVIVANGDSATGPLQQATRTIPIVFVNVGDPVGAGYVASLAQPGGNVTGFTAFEFTLSAKWLELLKDIAPRVTRAAIIRDPTVPGGVGQYAAIQGAAVTLGLELVPVNMRSNAEIDRGVTAFARQPNGGLITTSPRSAAHRSTIIALAARYRLPAVYPYRYHVTSGGLIAYGADTVEQYRQAAAYVDRILKGEKPADLPVQAPTKYELVINLKTAKALGLDIPPAVLARADEVIE
jgi:putative tryptophan/tyrosine transport system substrate-binding protein